MLLLFEDSSEILKEFVFGLWVKGLEVLSWCSYDRFVGRIYYREVDFLRRERFCFFEIYRRGLGVL